jgi:hypothetical protein
MHFLFVYFPIHQHQDHNDLLISALNCSAESKWQAIMQVPISFWSRT